MIDPSRVRGLVAEVLPIVVELRRAIHRRPELAYQEFQTTSRLADLLRDRGLAPRLRTPKTGLITEVGGGAKSVGFRADIDALPIQEPSDLPFASEVAGAMHACGHDAHAAIAAGIAIVLHQLGSDLSGRVRIIFQPAEETFPGGAWELVREGAVEGLAGIIAFHADPSIAAGRVGLRTGPLTASTDRFFITLEGPGGHTARPHKTVDLIFAAGKVIAELPGLLDRLTDSRRPLVVVFGKVGGGSAENVIPTMVELSGTARALDREIFDEVPSLLERLVQDIAAPTGAKVTFHYQRGVPPVINHQAVVAAVAAGISELMDDDVIVEAPTSMGAEDFSRYAEEVPGALLRLGCRQGQKNVDLHSANFEIDETALEVGVNAGVAALLSMLERL